jgi:predicted Fe-Mo cluster-binding NifX family protein
MVAIPVMRGRMAPVLNWCSRMLIFSAIPDEIVGRELWVLKLGPDERLQLLQEKGVDTLICGALSADLQYLATKLGLTIIPGVAGEVGEVLTAYRENRLSQREFWFPGCQGTRRYRRTRSASERAACIPPIPPPIARVVWLIGNVLTCRVGNVFRTGYFYGLKAEKGEVPPRMLSRSYSFPLPRYVPGFL